MATIPQVTHLINFRRLGTIVVAEIPWAFSFLDGPASRHQGRILHINFSYQRISDGSLATKVVTNDE